MKTTMKTTIKKLIKALNTPKNPPDQIPYGWFTTKQLSSEMGKSLAQTSKRLRKEVKLGGVLVKKFNTYVNKTLVRPVPHFKLK
jgi:hypothetical protein